MHSIKSITRYINFFISLTLIVGVLFFVDTVSASTKTVFNTNDSGGGSLRQAIIDANPDDTILFSSFLSGQTITLNSEITIDKDINIDGSSLEQPIQISGNDSVRVFLIEENAIVIIDSIVIRDANYWSHGGAINNNGSLFIVNSILTNNYAREGGGICNNGVLYVANCLLSENSALYGAGVANRSAISFSIIDSTISDNEARYWGGGLTNNADNVTITNNLITGNSAEFGGGIYSADDGVTYINESLLSNNTATYGGGIHIYNGGGDVDNIILTNSSIIGNIAEYGGGISSEGVLVASNVYFYNNDAAYGGAIYGSGNTLSKISIENSIISTNSSSYGGGVFSTIDDFSVENCIFNNNSSIDGGGMYNEDSHPIIINSTYFENSASGHGSSIFNEFSNPTLINTIIWDSFDSIILRISNQDSNPTIINSDIKDCGGSTNWITECGIDAGGNIDLDPMFIDLITSDFHLQSKSPAIDTGNNDACPNTDIDGVIRPKDGNGDDIAICDMGAYEFDPMPNGIFLPLILK